MVKTIIKLLVLFPMISSAYSESWHDITQAPNSNDIYVITTTGDTREINGIYDRDADRPNISNSNIVGLAFNSVTNDILALSSNGKVFNRIDDSTTSWTEAFSLSSENWKGITQAPGSNDIYVITSSGDLREINGSFSHDADRPDISNSVIVDLASNSVTGDILALTSDGNVYNRPDDSSSAWNLAFSLPQANWIGLTQAPGSNDMYVITSSGDLREINGSFSHDADRPDINDSNIVGLTSNSVSGDILALTSDGKVYSRPDDSTTAWTQVFSLPQTSVCTSAEAGTVNSDLDIHMPSLNYQTLFGTQSIWVDFEYYGTGPNGELLWKLKDGGVNQ